uniref:Uncharacterized protein n=1 Tax=Anguilla anguilla TaxID=7936 RepID=A0A0E9VIN3_ANGAN
MDLPTSWSISPPSHMFWLMYLTKTFEVETLYHYITLGAEKTVCGYTPSSYYYYQLLIENTVHKEISQTKTYFTTYKNDQNTHPYKALSISQ